MLKTVVAGMHTGTEDIYDYLLIKSNNQLLSHVELSKKHKQHFLKFPSSPFKDTFDLLSYDKNVTAFFLKDSSPPTKSYQSIKTLHKQKTFLKNNLSQLLDGLSGNSLFIFAKYVNWKQLTTNELDMFEALLFAHVATYNKSKALIKPYTQYLKLYKEKTGKDWQIRYVEHIQNESADNNDDNIDIGDMAWYTYKVSEFSTAYYLYSNAADSQAEISHWFYLGLSLFYLSKYEEAKRVLRRFLKADARKKNFKKLHQNAHYYYYRCFDKQRTGKNKLAEIYRYCRKNPSEKMYRLLLRLAKRHQYPHYDAILKSFLERYPSSHTAYLKRRQRAFNALRQGETNGLTLLREAYSRSRKKVYKEIVHWGFTENGEVKENYFGEKNNWFVDYFYQNAKDSYSKKVWKQWMFPLKSKLKLNDEMIDKYKVFYWKNEKKKWQWFEKTPRGYGSKILIEYWTPYTNRIETFIRFGYGDLIEKEIKNHFPQTSKERLLFLRTLYNYSSNTHQLASLYAQALNSYGNLMGGIPHTLYKYAYPLHRYKEVKALSKRHNIPVALIYSVMRAESFYKEEAVSFAGAIGLMQVMPATGKWIYEKTKLKNQFEFDLFSPEVNLKIGVQFLADLYQEFDGNIVLAAAAYNAGGGSVRKWIRNNPTTDWIHFSHFIPYDQTERYVRKVIRNIQAYRTLYPFLDKF